MSFDLLHPALQAQIVNQLGWQALRPVQEQTIAAVVGGANCVVLAPTAGGKTEAAMFPTLSLMHAGGWTGTSALYIAPIRALLNNQEERLRTLTGLLGRTAAKWHGDVSEAARRRFLADPADLLAITPESIEALLMSQRLPGRRMLSGVRVVIIDEVHAFAADDRGAHLMALLERVAEAAGHDLQRIGLSATVGDPARIVGWLSGSSARPQVVVDPGGARAEPEVCLDFVGGVANAAHVIDALHPGRRRLVFVDSRRRVEELGAALRARGVSTFLSHSSLALSERAAAERAFAEEPDCVIVATSALELGIDVGDLDHVLQLDAPSSVSSFLQRMGRTGRRAGTRANCTLLCTSDEALLQGAGLLRLWAGGFVEPADPDPAAAHVLAHQILALSVAEGGCRRAGRWALLRGAAPFASLDEATLDALVDHMLRHDILTEADGRLLLGAEGERHFGRRHFQELTAVFSTPRVLTVVHDGAEIGSVDAFFLQQADTGGPVQFTLAGRAWQVERVGWRQGICVVAPASGGAPPRWQGTPRLLHRPLCEAMRAVLCAPEDAAPARHRWTRRATERLARIRAEHAHLDLAADPQPLEPEGPRLRWWTFAGGRANNLLAAALRAQLGERVSVSNLHVTLADGAASSDVAVRRALQNTVVDDALAARAAPDLARGRLSKFERCLPDSLARALTARALTDRTGAQAVLDRQRADGPSASAPELS